MKIKYEFQLYQFYNLTNITKHLEEMAAQGWFIKSANHVFWTYEAKPPKKVKYAATYNIHKDAFIHDSVIPPQTFLDFCTDSGWDPVCNQSYMQILINEDGSAVPFDTDPVVEIRNIHNAAKKRFLPMMFIQILTFILLTYINFRSFFISPVSFFTNYTKIFVTLLPLLGIFYYSVEIIAYFRWYRSATRLAKQNIFYETESNTLLLKIIYFAILFFAVLYFLLNLFQRNSHRKISVLIALPIIMVLVRIGPYSLWTHLNKLKNGKVLRILNLLILFIFVTYLIHLAITNDIIMQSNSNGSIHLKHPPFTLSDFTDIHPANYVQTYDYEETIFAAAYTYQEHPLSYSVNQTPVISYDIIHTAFPFLKNRFIQQYRRYMQSPDIQLADIEKWQANEVYYVYDSHMDRYRYLICYDDQLFYIALDQRLSDDDISYIQKKLMNEQKEAD